MTTTEILYRAKTAKRYLPDLSDEQKSAALCKIADRIILNTGSILEANKKDIGAAAGNVPDVMLDRLALSEDRIHQMAEGIRKVASLPDPIGKTLSEDIRPNGLKLKKITCPIGAIAIIYESRPNVTSDAAALALKSGNVCILRGGKEAFQSSFAIVKAMKEGLTDAGLPEDLILLVEDITRNSATELMHAEGFIDLLIPRGGKGLIRTCIREATVPCIQTGEGLCHIYVDYNADVEKALAIIENAKTSRPSVCNAEEVLLVHENIAAEFLPKLSKRLREDRIAASLIPVEFRCDPVSITYMDGVPAKVCDYDTEFLDYILAVKIVSSVRDAVEHIRIHSTGHSEAILTEDRNNADYFTKSVDSAAVYVNASTRFTDGGEFGLGCEMGISTQKLHARGPLGLCELTSYKYIIDGNGQIR